MSEGYLRATGRTGTKRLNAIRRAAETAKTEGRDSPAFRIVDAGTYQPVGLAAEMDNTPREPWMDVPRNGVFCLSQDGAAWVDKFYHVSQLDRMLRDAGQGRPDLYVSQQVFGRRERGASCGGLGLLCHADLDLHNVLAGDYTMSQVVAHVLAGIDGAGLPRPSYICFTGRGFAAKWLFSQAIPARALPRLKACNVEICRRLQPLAADRRATDHSRVLRVVGSINSKSGERVRVVWSNESLLGTLVRYDFTEFSSDVLPLSPRTAEDREAARVQARLDARNRMHPGVEELRREREAARAPRQRGAFPAAAWAGMVISDLEALVKSRWGSMAPEGYRHNVSHLAGCCLAQIHTAAALEDVWVEWVRRYVEDGYADSPEFRRAMKPVLKRAQRAERGEQVEHEGVKRPVHLTYSKQAIIELLGITPDEQAGLAALVGDDVKRARARTARRQRGRSDRQRVTGHDRSAYTAERAQSAQERAQRARTMRGSGMSWRAISEALGTTPDGARKLASRAA